MNNLINSVTLGGLLHDIGKLIQRTGQGEYLQHSKAGYDFLKDKNFALSGQDKQIVLDCVLYHHETHLKSSGLPETNIAYIVCEADNIAAGLDRKKIEDSFVEGKAQFDKEMVLQSVFDLLKNREDTPAKNGYRLRTLDENLPINYPVPLNEVNLKAAKDKYFTVFNKVESNLIEYFKGSRGSILSPNSLLHILEASASYVPSSTSTSEIPDISLYDHLKLTGAAAGCLYLYLEFKSITNYKKWFSQKNHRSEPCFLLVSADVSGIQNFIYTIASKAALKSLRARSFYLELMLEHMADEILEELSLSRANLLYTGGGHFYMLLPNTSTVKEALKKAELNFNNWLLEKYNVSMYLALAYQDCSAQDLMSGSLREIYGSLSEKLSQNKVSRYSVDQLSEMMNPNSELYKNQKGSRECVICRYTDNGISSIEDKEDKEITEDDKLCQNCKNLIKAGKLILKERKDDKDSNNGNNDTLLFCITTKLPDDCEKAFLELPSINGVKKYLVFKYLKQIENSADDFIRIYSKNKRLQGHRYYSHIWVGDYSAPAETTDGNITLKELAEQSMGINRLAVLRADVDSLGKAFSSGFPEKFASLSRTSVLSRQLSLFFKFYINNICRKETQGIEKGGSEPFYLIPDAHLTNNMDRQIVIVYSGGDDVFAVGAWHHIVEFAVDLNNCFKKFTSNRMTLSAGIGFFHDKFPIYQMAQLAGKLEEFAKDNPGKDSIALFGVDDTVCKCGRICTNKHVYHWDDFITSVCKEKLGFLLDNFQIDSKDAKDKDKFNLSMGFLYRLINLLQEADQEQGINLARLAYNLARLEPSHNDSAKKDKFAKIKEKIYNWAKAAEERRQLITAINLMIYLNRKKESQK